LSRGFSQQEREDYDDTLTLVIEEIVPEFVKEIRITMIQIQYEIKGEKSLYFIFSYLHERGKIYLQHQFFSHSQMNLFS
jgi:hypothetical protein